MEGRNGLRVVKPTDPTFLRALENSIRIGSPLLVEDVGEALDPALEPLLQKAVFKQVWGLRREGVGGSAGVRVLCPQLTHPTLVCAASAARIPNSGLLVSLNLFGPGLTPPVSLHRSHSTGLTPPVSLHRSHSTGLTPLVSFHRSHSTDLTPPHGYLLCPGQTANLLPTMASLFFPL
eukprot:360969-Chlamydomonas_euryale.AAC.1